MEESVTKWKIILTFASTSVQNTMIKFIGEYNALEGGRENHSSLVVYLYIVFADELDHSILHAS